MKILFLVTWVISSSATACAQPDTILQRYKRWLFDTHSTIPVKDYLTMYNPVTQWPDIDYTDVQPANWKVSGHLKRVRDLALEWSYPASPHYHDKVIWNTIQPALDHWLEMRYQSVNWWHNKIGVPQLMRDIVILLRDTLSKETITQSLEVMAQFGTWKTHMGANLVWSADIALHYGAITGDTALIQTCSAYLINEIKITTGEGIQPDLSFHQHGARLQMYQYGSAFLRDNVRLSWQLNGTPWAFPKEKIKILSDFVLRGWQWMARGIHTVPGTMDRSVSRLDALRAADIRSLVPFLHELDPTHSAEYRDLERRQDGTAKPLNGFRYFPYSDFAVYHTGSFSFFLKTMSVRTLPSESINHENLKGKLLNSGDAYIVKNGSEYYNLMPVWNWEQLPGVTAFAGADQLLRQPWVGAVTDGKSGAVGMDYRIQGVNGSLFTAKKAWFCHNGEVVCLVAGMKTDSISSGIYTSLDQCRWQGDVFVSALKSNLREGDHHFDSLRWVLHNGIGYLFHKPEKVRLRLAEVTGSWQTINASAGAEPVTEKVFLPQLLHDKQDLAAYTLAPCKTAAQAEAKFNKRSWSLLRNDSVCQAIQYTDGTIFCLFYQPSAFLTFNKTQISVDKPCALIIKGKSLFASNPFFKAAELTIRIGKRKWVMQLPADGSTAII